MAGEDLWCYSNRIELYARVHVGPGRGLVHSPVWSDGTRRSRRDVDSLLQAVRAVQLGLLRTASGKLSPLRAVVYWGDTRVYGVYQPPGFF